MANARRRQGRDMAKTWRRHDRTWRRPSRDMPDMAATRRQHGRDMAKPRQGDEQGTGIAEAGRCPGTGRPPGHMAGASRTHGEDTAETWRRGHDRTWQRQGRDMPTRPPHSDDTVATTQRHGKVTSWAKTWRRRGNHMAETWRRHGNRMAQTRGRHGTDMAEHVPAWRRHGKHGIHGQLMARHGHAYQCQDSATHGKDMAMTRP